MVLSSVKALALTAALASPRVSNHPIGPMALEV